jgi:hypothetical protein
VIRSFALHDVDFDSIAAMERWYFRDHAPEIVRRYGPWLSRFECFLPVPAPADAAAYNVFNWRTTEGWWRELPTGSANDMCFTPPPAFPRVAACFVPPEPTEAFLVGDFLPLEKAALRWLVLLRYPEGVAREDGDEWFVRTHGPELAAQPGLLRFASYRAAEDAGHVPGRWRPGTAPPADQVYAGWDRVSELWFETFSDWRNWLAAVNETCTRPAWATRDAYPFVQPPAEFASTFLLERPNDDFLRDLRAYVP